MREIGKKQADQEDRPLESASSRAVCGAALFLAAVETSWQLHSRYLSSQILPQLAMIFEKEN
jgi:hypothetical protein